MQEVWKENKMKQHKHKWTRWKATPHNAFKYRTCWNCRTRQSRWHLFWKFYMGIETIKLK